MKKPTHIVSTLASPTSQHTTKCLPISLQSPHAVSPDGLLGFPTHGMNNPVANTRSYFRRRVLINTKLQASNQAFSNWKVFSS